MLRYEIIINKSKKETKSNGNIWYKLSKNSHKRKNILMTNLQFYVKYGIIINDEMFLLQFIV